MKIEGRIPHQFPDSINAARVMGRNVLSYPYSKFWRTAKREENWIKEKLVEVKKNRIAAYSDLTKLDFRYKAMSRHFHNKYRTCLEHTKYDKKITKVIEQNENNVEYIK